MSRIEVLITDEKGTQSVSGGGGSSPIGGNSQTNINSQEAITNKRSATAIAVGTMAAQRVINYTTSNVAKWSGSVYKQTQLNNAIELGGLGLLGLHNPALAAGTLAISVGLTAADYAYEQKWDKKRSKQDLARLGYSSQGEMLGRKR